MKGTSMDYLTRLPVCTISVRGITSLTACDTPAVL